MSIGCSYGRNSPRLTSATSKPASYASSLYGRTRTRVTHESRPPRLRRVLRLPLPRLHSYEVPPVHPALGPLLCAGERGSEWVRHYRGAFAMTRILFPTVENIRREIPVLADASEDALTFASMAMTSLAKAGTVVFGDFPIFLYDLHRKRDIIPVLIHEE